VEDDGLPRGSKVASHWKKNSGPGEVELSATDGEKSNSLKG